MSDGPALHIFASVAGAFFATICSIAPDNIMARYMTATDMGLSTYGSNGVIECTRHIMATEGLRSFGRGWLPFFVRMSIIFSAQMSMYEQCRRLVGLDYLS